ncbi:MAG: minichromosome maintenance protein MCM [archaeon]
MTVNLKELEESSGNPFIDKFEKFFKVFYKKDIEELAESYPGKKSLRIDFEDLQKFDFELADELLENPDIVLQACDEAITRVDLPTLSEEKFVPFIRFCNLPIDKKPLIRNIGAKHLSKLLAVEGIIRQTTDVLPKIKLAIWQCRRCANTYKIIQDKHELTKPAFCECRGKDFNLIAEKSEFIDYQKIQVQEPLELLKGGEQAINLDVYLSNDLVNKVTAGDRIELTGTLRLVPPKAKGTVFGRHLEAIHVEETQKEFEELEVNKEDEKEIRKLAARKDVYELLTKSIAPNIYGHEIVKQAIALQMFGGIKKELTEGSKIRGNIHVLLVGDPSTGKSQLLQYADKLAPRSIYVSGKSASGAGLTVSAVKDDFGEGGWTLKAGALVLANGGLGCIDEFDKMDTEDRSAMHEAMAQQQVSVSKAGLYSKFKTETSVLAAANPKFSRFDPYMSYMEQINLPPSLISRFDLFFVMKDVLDRKKDEETTKHILSTHQMAAELQAVKTQGKKISQKTLEEIEAKINPAIEIELFKKYVSFARQRIFPILTSEATKTITDFYLGLRDQGRKDGSFAATHRQLEGLIRLAEASARVKLKDIVEAEDAQRAVNIFRYSLQEVVTDPETGKIDIDIITSGQTHSQVTGMKKVLMIVREKGQEMDKIPIDMVISEAKSEGLEQDKVMEFISKLKKTGELYEPRHGFLKPTQKN